MKTFNNNGSRDKRLREYITLKFSAIDRATDIRIRHEEFRTTSNDLLDRLRRRINYTFKMKNIVEEVRFLLDLPERIWMSYLMRPAISRESNTLEFSIVCIALEKALNCLINRSAIEELAIQKELVKREIVRYLDICKDDAAWNDFLDELSKLTNGLVEESPLDSVSSFFQNAITPFSSRKYHSKLCLNLPGTLNARDVEFFVRDFIHEIQETAFKMSKRYMTNFGPDEEEGAARLRNLI